MSTSSSMINVFAIGHRDYIELRSGIDVPRRVICKWSRGKKIIKQVFYNGGRVITFVPRTTFGAKFGVVVRKDKLITLASEWRDKVLDSGWRRRNL